MRDDFTVIDAHMHYNGIFLPKHANFIEYIDANGIDAAVVNTLNVKANLGEFSRNDPVKMQKMIKDRSFELFREFRDGQPDHRALDKLMASFPDRIFPFFWYNPADPSDESQEKGLSILTRSLDGGYRGVKIQLAMTPCKIEKLYPVCELLLDYKCPLFIHPCAGLFAAERTSPSTITGLCKRYPDLNIILGHAAYSMEFCIETITAALSVKNLGNLYFETSVSIPFGIISLLKFFGPDRVIFGSDAPAATPFIVEYGKINTLSIPRDVKEKVLSTNIARLIRLE
ncbi:MAG: amidohydrolase family protein [Promethearchaeota archaeon]